MATVALAKEESWEYALPEFDEPVATVTVALGGTCMLMCEGVWREAMVGTLGFYGKGGERLHTVYTAATPVYGKLTFFDCLDREVATGRLITDLGPTRTSADFAAHLRHVVAKRPDRPRYHWVLDNLNTHWSLDVCREVAAWCDIPFEPESLATGRQRRAFLSDPTHRHVFYFTPVHVSWLNQVELWFSTLTRRFLAQGDFDSIEAFESQLGDFVAEYNRLHAHPYRWTYAGTPLVRGIPFSRTRAQERHGRAWSSPRSPLYQRLIYPPRPYLRQAEAAAQGLAKS